MRFVLLAIVAVGCGGETEPPPQENSEAECLALAPPCADVDDTCSAKRVGETATCELWTYTCGPVSGLATNDGRWCVYSPGPTCSDDWVEECSGDR